MSEPALCPVIESCGGCPLLGLTAQDERSHKLELLLQLQMAIGLADMPPTLVCGEQRINYRNRIRLRIDNAGLLAFFNEAKSHSCAVLVPELRQYVNLLCEWVKDHQAIMAPFAYLEARTLDRDGRYGLYLTVREARAASSSLSDALSAANTGQLIATNLSSTLPWQRFSIDDKTYQYVPLNGFLQINFDVNAQLARHVVDETQRRQVQTFADLYCGSGNFALPLGEAGLRGAGVECVTSSILAARAAARDQGIDAVQFHDGDALDQVQSWLQRGCTFDLVLLDPPRAGVRRGLALIARLAKRCIAYCSCNPDTLKRDLLALRNEGWLPECVTGFDMFPGTRHLEIVAWLRR